MEFKSDFGSAQTLQLASAILIYKSDADRTGGESLATVHRVSHTADGKAHIGPGSLPSTAALQKMASDLFSVSILDYLPANVLAYSPHRLVWYQPSCLRRIWFSKILPARTSGCPRLNGKLARWPALLFSADNHHLAVFALANDKRPVPETVLYRAPFPNVEGHGGGVALCSARPPNHISIGTMAGWERSFYDTEFTHGLNAGVINGDDYAGLWEAMTDKDKQPDTFPANVLKPTQSTLATFLKSRT